MRLLIIVFQLQTILQGDNIKYCHDNTKGLTLASLIPAIQVFISCSDSAQNTLPSLDVIDDVAGTDALG